MIFNAFVPGKPLPKGSLRHIGNGRMIEQTKVKTWMADIQAHVSEVYQDVGPMFTTPVSATITFWFPRPLAAKNRLYPHMRSVGDIDKLVRAVLDALQPSVISDDSLVVRLDASKFYESDVYPAGAFISIQDLT